MSTGSSESLIDCYTANVSLRLTKTISAGFSSPSLPGGQVRARHLRDASSFGCVSCGWVFSRFFLCVSGGLMASGRPIGMVGCFLILQCSWHFRKNENILDKSCSILPQGINTFGVVLIRLVSVIQMFLPMTRFTLVNYEMTNGKSQQKNFFCLVFP